MHKYKCRTCLAITDKATCMEINEICYESKTVKEIIVHLVPQMVRTLSDEEFICTKCLSVLQSCERFIQQCLTVESTIEGNKHILENSQLIFVEDIARQSGHYSGDTIEIGEEDVIISVEESGNSNIIDADHSYSYKSDAEEENPDEDTGTNDTVELMDDIRHEVNELVSLINPSNQIVNVQDLGNNYQGEEDSRPIQIIYRQSNSESVLQHEEDVEGHEDDVEGHEDEEPQETMIKIEQEELAEEEQDLELEVPDEPEPYDDGGNLSSYYQSFKTNNPEQEYECDSCGELFPSEETYDCHKNKNNATICEICGKTFKTNTSLRFHVGLVHNNPTGTFECATCHKTFRSKFHLNTHVKTNHERITRQQCQECGKLFNNMAAYNTHYRLIHLNQRPYVCDICGKDFGRRDYLRKHIVNKHTENGEKKPERRKRRTYGLRLKDPGGPVPCRICGKSVSNLHVLKAHLKTHIITKRHKCGYCELTFTLSANRNRHEKLHDLDPDNKFRCNICWKRVKTEDELSIHIMGHNNRPPQHSCDMCGERFHRKYLLHNHYLFQHTAPEDIERAEKTIILENLAEYSENEPKLEPNPVFGIESESMDMEEEIEEHIID